MAFSDQSHEKSELWELADSIDSSLSESQQRDLKCIEFLNAVGKIVHEKAEPTGSCVEGTKVNTPKDKGDTDALIISGSVCLEEELLDYLPDYPAFLRIKYDGEHTQYFTESDLADDKYILADTLRKMTEKHFLINRFLTEALLLPIQMKRGLTYSHTSAVGMERRTVKIPKDLMKSSGIEEREIEKFDKMEACRFLLEKASDIFTMTSDEVYPLLGDFIKTNTQWIKSYLDKIDNIKTCHENERIDGAVLVKSVDFVPAYRVKMGTWPRVSQEWFKRQRTWPPEEVVKAIMEAGYHVVAKPLPHLVRDGKFIGKGPDVYFRLSFSVSEVLLAKSMNRVQLTCWRILKAYQKGFLETSPCVLTSYHWKNVMFWLCEWEDEKFWVEENLESAVKKAIEIMLRWVSEGFLPQYFCRTMNLFGHSDCESEDLVKERLSVIYKEPLAFLKDFLDNPPQEKLCSMDTAEIGVGCRNKIIETGHASLCSVAKRVGLERDVNRIADWAKNVASQSVDMFAEVAHHKEESNETKDLIQNTVDVTKRFVNEFCEIDYEDNDGAIESNLKKSFVNLGTGVTGLLNAYFSSKKTND